MEYVGSFVVPSRHGPGSFERVEAPLDLVSAGIPGQVESSGATASAHASSAVGSLVSTLGDRVPDLPSSQVLAVSTRAVCLVPAYVVRSRTRAATDWTRNADAIQDRDQLRSFTPLSWGCQNGQWTVGSRHWPSESSPSGHPVSGRAPRRSDALGAAASPRHTRRPATGPGGMLVSPAHCGVPRSPPSGRSGPRRQRRRGPHAGSSPTCHRPTTCDAGHGPSATSRSEVAGPAKAGRSAVGREFR